MWAIKASSEERGADIQGVVTSQQGESEPEWSEEDMKWSEEELRTRRSSAWTGVLEYKQRERVYTRGRLVDGNSPSSSRMKQLLCSRGSSAEMEDYIQNV